MYDAIREHLGCPYPAYINHETGLYSPILKSWVFLPRRISRQAYTRVRAALRCVTCCLLSSLPCGCDPRVGCPPCP